MSLKSNRSLPLPLLTILEILSPFLSYDIHTSLQRVFSVLAIHKERHRITPARHLLILVDEMILEINQAKED